MPGARRLAQQVLVAVVEPRDLSHPNQQGQEKEGRRLWCRTGKRKDRGRDRQRRQHVGDGECPPEARIAVEDCRRRTDTKAAADAHEELGHYECPRVCEKERDLSFRGAAGNEHLDPSRHCAGPRREGQPLRSSFVSPHLGAVPVRKRRRVAPMPRSAQQHDDGSAKALDVAVERGQELLLLAARQQRVDQD